MTPPWHYEDEALVIRKLCVGPLENNVFVVACRVTGRAVIIDAAGEAERIIEACADLVPVAVLTTHGHHDHVGAAATVGERLAIPMRIHRDDVAAAGGAGWAPIEDGERIAFGAASLEAVHTPGHTPGSMCFVSPGLAFTGDTLFPGGPGATGGVAVRFATIMDSLRSRLFTLPDGTLVLPGHGADTTIGAERPHLGEWQRRGW